MINRTKNVYPYNEVNTLLITYTGTRSIEISGQEIDSGYSRAFVPFHTFDNIVLRCFYDLWSIDLNSTGINTASRVGGIIDGITLTASKEYIIMAFADQYGNPSGFGAMLIPESSYSISSGNKGLEATLTSLTKAYRFTVGARVKCEVSNSEWNLGTVTEIVSATSIKVLLDNNLIYGKTYGTNLTNSGTVTQLNKYTPYLPDDSAQTVYYPHYRPIARLKTSSGSNIEGILQLPYKDNAEIGFIAAWHQNLGAYHRIIPDDYVSMDGTTCKVDRSPFIGETLQDLNGDARFLRGSSTSGTLELATEIMVAPTDISGALRLYMENFDQNASLLSSARTYYQTTGLTSGGTTDFAYTTRPINMSVVWLLKAR